MKLIDFGESYSTAFKNSKLHINIKENSQEVLQHHMLLHSLFIK